VPVKGCRVSYEDIDGVTHSVDVFASSIFDAVLEAIVAFHAGGLNARKRGVMTDFLGWLNG